MSIPKSPIEKWLEGFMTFTFDQKPIQALGLIAILDRVDQALPTRYGEGWDISLGKKAWLISNAANKLKKRRVLRSFRKGRQTYYVHYSMPECVEQDLKNRL